MARLERRRWESEITSGLPRKDRASCQYQAYIPDHLMDRTFAIDGKTAADISDAEQAIQQLNETTGALAGTETLARLLLRAESVASSRIEGLEVGGRRLLKNALERQLGIETSDVTAGEVLANIDAMNWSISTVSDKASVTVDDICDIHTHLLSGTHIGKYAGILRTTQNWIGGSSYNPCSAQYVPPPERFVAPLMDDLCNFVNDDSLPPVAQAAIAHAQFETLHPFVDGNGRTGRALIHVILRRRNLTPNLVPPISLVLATRSRDYIDGLVNFRYIGRSSSRAASEGLNQWLSTFAAACVRSALDADVFEAKIKELTDNWQLRIGKTRAGSAVTLLMEQLPSAPLLTVKTAAELIDRSEQATNEAIGRLVDGGILEQMNIGRRNRAFQAVGVIEAFTDLERSLASPLGNTKVSPPSRRVPRRAHSPSS